MPRVCAMASVLAPWYPCRRKAAAAARRMSMRRASAAVREDKLLFELLREVVGHADLLDLLELGLQPVDVLLLVVEDLLEQHAGSVVPLFPAQLDARVEAG